MEVEVVLFRLGIKYLVLAFRGDVPQKRRIFHSPSSKTTLPFHVSSNYDHYTEAGDDKETTSLERTLEVPSLKSDVGLLPTVFSNMDASETNLPYPAQTEQTAGLVDGIPTDVMVVSFGDKIMVTVTQAGRLAQWVKASGVPSLDVTDRRPRSTCLYLTTTRRIQIHT
jgi:hypothetical protein